MTLPLSPLTAMASAVTLGIADFSGGFAGRRSSAPSVAIAVESVGLVAVPLAFVLLPHGWDAQAAVQAFAGGAIGGFGLVAFYRAMSLNLIGVVAPITGFVAAALPVAVGLIGGDRLEVWQVAGMVVGLAALVLINGPSREGVSNARLGVSLALFAGLAFGMFFILFHDASHAGVTAFVSGRFGSAAASLVTALVLGVSPIVRRSVLGHHRDRRRVRRNRGCSLPVRNPHGSALGDGAAHVLLPGVHRALRSPLHARTHDAAAGPRRRTCGGRDRHDRGPLTLSRCSCRRAPGG